MKYKKRRHWKNRLEEDESYLTEITPDKPIRVDFPFGGGFIQLDMDGQLTVGAGYVWDGASGPTFDTKNTKTPSLIHDAIYNLFRLLLLDIKWRKQADRTLYDMLRARKMFKWRAKLWYRGVRTGASHSARYDVLEAP